jgi:hypothetical protein
LSKGSIATLLAAALASGCASDAADPEQEDGQLTELAAVSAMVPKVDPVESQALMEAAIEAAGGVALYQPDTSPTLSLNEVEALAAIATAAVGDPLPGFDPVEVAAAKEAFNAVEEITDGVGPIFNERGCGICHNIPATGGSGAQIERRFGRLQSDGTFFAYDGSPNNQGGTLRQLFSNGTFTNGSTTCTIPVEREPSDATIHNVGRRSIALFGLGLFDSLPDAVFGQVQATQPAATRGLARRVSTLLPDSRDPNQSLGGTRLARFGWKLNVPSLVQFSADAYLNEMGITTQSCFKGSSVLAFASEQFPNNVAPPSGCNGGDLAPPQPAGNGVPTFTDDAVGSCAGGLDEVQDDVSEFLTFMETLAPTPRDFSDGTALQFGPGIYDAVGCDDCHVTGTFITPFSPFNGVPERAGFRPFGDFMLHDMGSLGDRIGTRTGESQFVTRLMRTAPLWGNRFLTQMLHDGRATTVRGAIQAHDGTARPSRDAFNSLSSTNQDLLIRYVRSL